MAKRKRGFRPKASNEKPSEYEDKSASKLFLNSHQDVADSEDEYLHKRDKILLEEPASKKSKRQQEEDEFLQASDEEVYADAGSSSDVEDDEVDDADGVDFDDEVQSDDKSEEDEMAGWGSSKAAYYNTDKITNEEEALAEEQEARRLQQKHLKSLSEADFAFDEGEWVGEGEEEEEQGDEESGGVVTEKLPQLQITPDMSDTDKVKLLRRRYPELEGFAKEFVELQSIQQELKKYAEQSRPRMSSYGEGKQVPSSLLRFWSLSAYIGALSMYFALLTSTARQALSANEESQILPMAPQDLREHEVMDYIRRTRETWERAQSMPEVEDSNQPTYPDAVEDVDGDLGDTTMLNAAEDVLTKPNGVANKPQSKKAKRISKSEREKEEASRARRAARLAEAEASFKNLDADLAKPIKTYKQKPLGAVNGEYDLGDEAPLDAHDAAEKAKRKKSLRFYTSRIAQKANKDERAGEGVGGDEDLPRRERWRDRMERLNREAEARGKKGGDEDMDQNEAEDDDDVEITNADREAMDSDEDYKELMGKVNAKKEKKQQREAAYATAKAQGARVERVVEDGVGADGKRKITYAIAKNKGLTPKRKKEIRNPRVKGRLRAEKKNKKLKTMKATYKGGEGRGYGGEETGIKSGLVKSVKL